VLEKILSDSLQSGLKITLVDQPGDLYGRVSWINWDSGFRDSGLRIEDRIVGMNGVPLTLPGEPRARRIERDRVVGGLQESAIFSEAGLKDGSPLTLSILRRNVPGRGWKALDIRGTVRAERTYYDTEGRPAIGPGGPWRLGRDSFGDSWLTWYERRAFDWEGILDGRWFGRLDNRTLLARHLEDKERIEAAVKAFPGPFMQRLQEDFESVADTLRGRTAPLPADALAFREASDEIEREIAAAGDAAWQQFLAANEAVDSLPALDLVRGDRTLIIGKTIALEGVSWRNAVTEGDTTILIAEHSGYPSFIAADQPAMRTFFQRQAEYQASVEPRVPERYDVIGRVAPDTRLVVAGRGAIIGLNIEVLAVRVPGHFFADLAGGQQTFTGAGRARSRAAAMPPDDASPGDVMRACIAALKAGDAGTWRALFCDWTAIGGEGMPLYHPFNPYANAMADYTRALNLVLHKVCHAEPIWESEPRPIIRGDGFAGAPQIDEVTVLMDHIGRFEDGDRVFCITELNRVWSLQRRDGGPWRIASRNVL
jgi:hypothetical protein